MRASKPDTPGVLSGEPHSYETRTQQATRNAELTEWGVFRQECLELAQRRLTLAETGARLHKASCRFTGLLTDGDEAFPFSSFGGIGGNLRSSPDLLPLPVPVLQTASEPQLLEMFPTDSPPTVEGFRYAAKAWL